MVNKIKSIIFKYKKSLLYILFSCLTASIETAAGLICLNCFGFNDVLSNTVGIIFGAVIHYTLVTGKVFDSRKNAKTALVYLATFIIGLLFQNGILYVCDSILLRFLNMNLAYLISKVLSLGISFFFIYQLRKKLYSVLGSEKNE